MTSNVPARSRRVRAARMTETALSLFVVGFGAGRGELGGPVVSLIP